MEKEREDLHSKFKNNLIELCKVSEGDKILIGCSGGPDSMALLHLLWRSSLDIKIRLIVCHINYKLRGEASDRDEEIVKAECKKLGIECLTFTMKLNKEYQLSNLEEKLRDYRYKLFNEEACKNKCNWIALAHNKDDQAETLLINLIRGAGTEGLSGMFYFDSDRRIIRPLLNVAREEILKYINDNNIRYGEDETNYSLAFTRNKVRNLLLPLLKKEFNPSIINILYQTSMTIREEGTLFEKICQKYIDLLSNKRGRYISIPRDSWIVLPNAVKRRMLRLMYRYLTGNTRRLHFIHIETILKMENKRTDECVIDLPNDVRAGIKNDILEFYFKDFYDKIKDFEYIINVPMRIKIEETGQEVELRTISKEEIVSYDKEKKTLYIDFDRCGSKLMIRNRRKGDIFKALGAPGKKKLKDYLIDKKIPKEMRDRLMLLCKGEEIICIVGIEINDDYKISSESKNILCVRVI